jgi:hypothetical protein
MLRDERIRQKLILDRERRTTELLFLLPVHQDTAGDWQTNKLILQGQLDQVREGHPAAFGTWRPPNQVQRFGRRKQPPAGPRYIPVLSPLLVAVVDLARLIASAVLWTWRALDGGR